MTIQAYNEIVSEQMKKLIPTEHDEAVALAEYLEILQKQGRIELYSHLPHETFTRNWGTKMRNRREGVKKGVPDYIVVLKHHVLFIELKRIKQSTVSLEQKAWITSLINKKTLVHIAYGFEDAKEKLGVYL